MNEYLVKTTKVTLFMMLIVLSQAEGEFRNSRRGGNNMGLFPFPRVGRADPSISNSYNDIHEIKRQGLIPFPRVGRSDLRPQTQASLLFPPWLIDDQMIEYQKRNVGNNVKGGMWFGPRLGRLQKRSFDDNVIPWTVVALKEPGKQYDYVPRSGREDEEEDNDDTVVETVLSRRLDSKTRNNISQQ